MATQVQFRGGTTTEHASFNGAAREVTVDTTKQTLVVQDGSTDGGFPLLREKNPDDIKLHFGGNGTTDNGDLQIYHDGDSSYIEHTTSGTDLIIDAKSPGDDLILRAADDVNIRVQGNEDAVVCKGDGAVELYYGGSTPPKLETTATGSKVNGDLIVTSTWPRIYLTDTDSNSDFSIINNNGEFSIFDDTNNAFRFQITTNGYTGVNCTPATGYGLDVKGFSGYDDIFRLTADGSDVGPRINLTPTGTGVSRINATANSLALQTGGTSRLSIGTTGDVSIEDGNLVVANTHGIDFSASEGGTGTSNEESLLNDYEEGTWTPTFNTNFTQNASYAAWGYTRVGRLVTIRGLLVASTVSGSNLITVSLPFASANMTGLSNSGGAGTMFKNISAPAGLASYIDNDTTVMKFWMLAESGNWTQLANDDVSTSSEIYVTHTYFAA